MHTRLTTFTIKPDTHSYAKQMIDQMHQAIQDAPGYRSITYFMNEANTELHALSVWESKEHAQGQIAALRDVIAAQAADIMIGPPTTQIYEVYEPKA